jgi:hypothetical protein
MTYAATANWLRQRLWMGWAVGAITWLVWVGSLAYGGWTRDAENQLFAADHIAFYTAAKLIRDGRQNEIYDYHVADVTQQEITGGDWPFIMGYRNPPFYALLYVPTAGFPLPLSALIWTVIGLGAFALAVWCLRPENPWRAAGWAFCFYPFFAAVSFGQNTLLSMAAFAGTYRLLADRRPFAAGLVAGLLWYKPQLLLGLFVWWALAPRRHLRCWLGVAVTGAVLAAVSWLVVPGASQAFVDSLQKIAAYGGENAWNKHSPRAFFTLVLPNQPSVVWGLTLASSVAVVGGAAWVARRTGAPVAVMFPVAVFVSLWVSPHTLVYEWALLVPAAVVLWDRVPERRDAWLTLFAAAWLALTVSTLLTKLQIEGLNVNTAMLSVHTPPSPAPIQASIPILGVVGWLAARELRRGAATPQPVVASK